MKPGGNKASKSTEFIRAEASQWVAKHDLGLSDAEQNTFLDWLAEDPRHSQLFEEQIEMWQSFDVLEQWKPQHSETPNPDLLATAGKDKRYHIPWVATCLGIAAIAVLILTGVLFWQQSPSGDREPELHYLADSSMSKGYERHQLQDGTTVQLNRNSQVAVHYGPHQRLVKLLSGEAHFEVEKDPERPFVVVVDGLKVRAVGTAFSVRQDSESVRVLVTEGHVQFGSDIENNRSEQPDLNSAMCDVFAGQQSLYSAGEGKADFVVEDVSIDEIRRALAWKDRLIEFNGAPLSEVVYELNLRNETQIKIIDSELRDRRITAAVRPDNVDGFIELLEAAIDIKARRVNENEIYLYP